MDVDFKFIKAKMFENAITQTELANKLGISRSSLVCKLSGRRSWKVEEIGKLSEILEVPINLLLVNKTNNFRVIPNQTLEGWYNYLLDGNQKEVIKSIAEVMYGNI